MYIREGKMRKEAWAASRFHKGKNKIL